MFRDDDGDDFVPGGPRVRSRWPRQPLTRQKEREFLARLNWEAGGSYRFGRKLVHMVSIRPYVYWEICHFVLARYRAGEERIKIRAVIDRLAENDPEIRGRMWDNLFAGMRRMIRFLNPDKPRMFNYRAIWGEVRDRRCPHCREELPKNYRLIQRMPKPQGKAAREAFSDRVDQAYRYEEDDHRYSDWTNVEQGEEPDWIHDEEPVTWCHWPKEE